MYCDLSSSFQLAIVNRRSNFSNHSIASSFAPRKYVGDLIISLAIVIERADDNDELTSMDEGRLEENRPICVSPITYDE